MRAVVAAALAVLAVSVAVVGAVPGVAAAAERAESYTFAFRDADISQVADEILGKALGLNYTVDPAITGKMSFRIENRLTRAQLLEAFEGALAANDVVLVRQGETVALMPRSKAKGAAGLRTTNGSHGGHAGYEVVAAPLSFAAPSEVAKALEAVGSGNVVVFQSDKSGLLLLGGDSREIEAATQLVRVLDRSGFDGARVRWYPLTRASAQTVSADLDKVLQGAGVTGVSVVPLKRLNGLFVFARTNEAQDRVGEWIAKLDQAPKESATALYVYHPRNVSAEGLSQTLGSLLSGRSSGGSTTVSGSAGAGGGGGGQGGAAATTTVEQNGFATSDEDPVRVAVDKESNTLVISASLPRWLQIQRVLDDVDRTPPQILIEATILEVTLKDDFRFGVDWSLMAAGGRLKVASSSNQAGAVAPTFPGLAVTFLDNDVSAAINALRSKTTVEVVSTPKVVALDNHMAKLQVGDQVPVVTQSAQSSSAPGAPLVVTTDYRSTGAILNVTPRVSGDDRITIQVSQEVSSVAKTTTSGIDSPTIQQRRMESTLQLRDGGTVALGGLISQTKSQGKSGVPWLQDVPLVGGLFRADTHNNDRTELIILLTARIMRDDASNERGIADLLADMREIQARDLVKTYVRR
jgi:general secretion pathway protein D